MEMIKSRNQTSHTYDETTADEIFRKIMEDICRHSSRLKSRWSQFGIENKAN